MPRKVIIAHEWSPHAQNVLVAAIRHMLSKDFLRKAGRYNIQETYSIREKQQN
jgi:hypothetical protein